MIKKKKKKEGNWESFLQIISKAIIVKEQAIIAKINYW